jgi:hypothetical protein
MSPSQMYRFIRIRTDGTLDFENLRSLRNAWHLCLPRDQEHWHIKLYPAVSDEVLNTVPIFPVLVSYDDAPSYVGGPLTACFIQPIPLGENTPIPADLRHPHQDGNGQIRVNSQPLPQS